MANKIPHLNSRARTVYFSGETLTLSNGAFIYMKEGDKWFNRIRQGLEVKMVEVSVGLRVELNRAVADLPVESIPRYALLS